MGDIIWLDRTQDPAQSPGKELTDISDLIRRIGERKLAPIIASGCQFVASAQAMLHYDGSVVMAFNMTVIRPPSAQPIARSATGYRRAV